MANDDPVLQQQVAANVELPADGEEAPLVGNPHLHDPLGLQQPAVVQAAEVAAAPAPLQPQEHQEPVVLQPPQPQEGGQPLDAAEVAMRSQMRVQQLENTIKTLQSTVQTLTSTVQVQVPTTTVRASNIVAKTTIETPKLAPGMTYRDYCYEVNNWRHYADQHIAKKDMAWLLLNHMPATDDLMIKKTLIERIGWTDLAKDDAVDKLLKEMQKIVECEPFTRLVEWLKGWENLEQGSKTYEKYTTELRKMSKAAYDDFEFKIPQTLLVAKLLYGCRDVQGSNIGLITAGLDLNGQADDRLYETVEAKVKTFIQSTDAYSRLKSNGSHSHKIHYTARDVFNKPLYKESPEKDSISVPSLTNKSAAVDEEDYQAFIAFKASKNATNGKAKGKFESREERRERLIGEGRCFEKNCESKAHVYEDCPKKKKRLADRKRQVEESGGTWYDDPEEAKKARLASTRPPHRNHIQFECKDDEISRDINDDDNVVMDELDEAQATRMFGTSSIYVTSKAIKEYNIGKIGAGTTIHNINYAKIRKDEALADSGCERGCTGPEAYQGYIEGLSPEDRKDVREFPGTARFKFGGDGIFTSMKEVIVPFYIAGTRKFMRMDVVQADVPILLGLPAMKQLRLGFQYDVKGQQDYGYFEGQKFKVYYKSGHHYIRIGKEGSLQSIVKNDDADEDDANKHFSTFITKVNVFDDDKVVSQLKQLHTNYAHLSQKKMIEVIKSAGQWKPEMKAIIESLMAKCPVKSCRTKEMTQSNAKADFRVAKRMGDIVAVDLKIRSSGKSVMYVIDTATSYAVAGFINDKSSQECGRILIRNWYGAGMPRIQRLVSDN